MTAVYAVLRGDKEERELRDNYISWHKALVKEIWHERRGE